MRLSARDEQLLAETFRLAAAIRDSVWPGWSDRTPFGVLLVAADAEFLVNYDEYESPDGFEFDSNSDVLGRRVWRRPRQFDPRVAAALPAFGGDSVIAIGRPEAMGRSCTSWVLAALHEHFHQFQTATPGYADAVQRLDLSRGDATGMWMLDFAFPYDSDAVAVSFAQMCEQLALALEESSPGDGAERFWHGYDGFLRSLTQDDRRYIGFQFWQEGVARYVELRAADVASAYYEPSPEFAALPGAEPFEAVWG